MEDMEYDYVPANRSHISFNEVFDIGEINNAMHVQNIKWYNVLSGNRNNMNRILNTNLACVCLL